MGVSVEFFGVLRQRAGVRCAHVASDSPLTLGQLLVDLSQRFPEFGLQCIERSRLKRGYVANIDGDRFVREPDTPLPEGATILLVSSDVGG